MIEKVLLILILATGPGQPDIEKHQEVDTIDHCWSMAQEFVKTPLPKMKNVIGIGAECVLIFDDGNDSE